MTDYILSDATRAKFRGISTASIATALFKRGLRNQFIQGVRPCGSYGANMVGQAFTLRYIPAREDRNPITDRFHTKNNLPNRFARVMTPTFSEKFRSLVVDARSFGIVPAISAEGVRQAPIFSANRPRNSHFHGRQSGEQLFK